MVIIVALALSCALYELDGDTGGAISACPTESALSGADLPCLCQGERVVELPYDVCRCEADGLVCEDGSTDTGMLPR